MSKEKKEKKFRLAKLDGIPDELKQLRQWVLWKVQERNGKKTKIPCDHVAQAVSVTNPKHYLSFDEVEEAYERNVAPGIGFVFTENDPYVGIDLDNAVTEIDGKLTTAEWANQIVEKLNSYTELSVSRTGLHILVRVDDKKILGDQCKNGNVECYRRDRYFCMSGCGKGQIENRQHEVEQFLKEYFPCGNQAHTKAKQQISQLSESALLEKMRTSKNADKLRVFLDTGDFASLGFPSQSEADLSFCMDLAWWTNRDPEMMDRIFRESAMYRDKWDERHSSDDRTYGKMTIDIAIANTHDGLKLPPFFGQSLSKDSVG